jgi:hypothetical protein
MNKAEMTQALAIAKSDADLMNEDIAIFDGYGLPDFTPVHVTVRQVARIIRWQAQYMNGEWDADEINSIANLGRKRFMIIG